MHARREHSHGTHARPPMRWCNNYVVTQSLSTKPQDIISTRIIASSRGHYYYGFVFCLVIFTSKTVSLSPESCRLNNI